VVNVTTFGAYSDGTHSAITTEAFRKAFASAPQGEIMIASGTYLIDNSTGPLVIKNFSGRVTFQGGAQLVFATNTNGGLLFAGGSGAVISGLRATYSRPPAVRKSPNEEIKFYNTVNTVLTDTVVENSPAAGILFFNSINPTVTNAKVMNSLADGLNFSNCRDARVTNLVTQNTGDDGLAFVNYTAYPNLTGGLARDVTITNSRARGIAVAGQSNVSVIGFKIQNTSSSGVLVAQDVANKTRVPAHVLIENGSVDNAGTLAPLVGNQYGVEFNSQETATFDNIVVFGSGNNGLSGTSPQGSVIVNNVTINSPLVGIGFLFYRTQSVKITRSAANKTPSYGLLALNSSHVLVEGLTVTNAGVADRLKRAVWFENAETISASSVSIVAGTDLANVVGCYTAPGHPAARGSVKISNFEPKQGNNKLSIENNCLNVSFAELEGIRSNE
jgi:hypothetical protein